MAYDGSLKFDTKIVDSGFSEGITKLSSMAKKGMTAVTGAMAGMSAYAIKVGADFEAGMSEVAAISGASAQDMEMLTDKAKEMGIQTKFSATEASEAMKYMAMAGWKAADMADGISGIMNLAAASGEELGAVSDIVTDALTAFGLQAKDSGHFADVLAKAASNSNTNVGMMGETFKYAAPLAGTLGYSVEDTAVAIGLMANAGIKGSQAGTAMRGMLTRLIKPTDEVQGAMDALGITISNADGTIKPFNQLMKEMRKAFSKLTDEEKAQRAASLAGQEAMSGFLAIINASDSDFDKLSKAIANADGTAQEMADTMNDNLKGKITLLGSSLEGAGIAAYEKFERPLKKAVEGAIENVNNLSREMSSGSLSESMDKVAQGFASIVDAGLNLATGAIPVIIDGFAFLVDHGNEVVAVLSALGSAFAVQKTIVPFINGVQRASATFDKLSNAVAKGKMTQTAMAKELTVAQAAVGLFGNKTERATAKTSLWNATCSAFGGTAGLALTAAIGLAVGIGALAAAYGNTDPLFKHNEAIKEAKKSYEALGKSKDEMIASSMQDINHYETLKEKLEMITDNTGKVKSGYEGLAKSIVEDLNQALGLNIEIVNGQITKYGEAMNQIDNYIAKMKASAIVEAQAEQMKKIEELYKENNKELAKIRQEKAKAEEECTKKEAELRAKGLSDAEMAKDTELGTLRGKLNGYQNQERALQEVQNGILDDRATYYDNLGKLESGRAEDLEAINNSELAEYTEQGERITKTLEEQHAEIEADIAAHEEAIKNTKDEAQKKILEDERDNLKKQLAEKEKEMKLERITVKEHLDKTVGMWIGSTKEIVKGSDIFDEMVVSGLNAALGFAKGLESPDGLDTVASASTKLGLIATTAAMKVLDEHSPSRVFRDDIGYMAGAGFALGFDKSNGLVKKSVTTMAQGAIDQAKRMRPLMEKDMSLDFSNSFAAMRSVAHQQVSDLSPSFSSNIYHTYNADKEVIDYNKIGKATAEAIAQEGIAVKFNNREFGRISKEWI